MASGSARTESLSALIMARRPLLTKVKAAEPSGFRSRTKVPTGMRSIISKTTCSWLRALVAEAEEGSPCMGRSWEVAESGGLTGDVFEAGADVDAGGLDEVCAGHAEFCADVASVGIDGEGGDAEVGGDGFAGHALADAAEDFEFAIGEEGGGVTGWVWGFDAAEGFEHFGDFAAESLVGVGFVDDGADAVALIGGEDEGAGFAGEDDDLGGGLVGGEEGEDFEAAAVWEGDIEDDEVWLEAAAGIEAVGDVVSCGDDIETADGAQHASEQLSEHQLVLDDQAAEAHGCVWSGGFPPLRRNSLAGSRDDGPGQGRARCDLVADNQDESLGVREGVWRGGDEGCRVARRLELWGLD